MAFNLLDSVNGLFGNDFMGKAGSLLGENESNIKNALSGITPSVLMGLLQKAGSGDPNSILNMAKDASRSGVLNNFSGLLSNTSLLSKGGDMLKSLFGDKLGNITSMISNFSGVRESSASSLMSMAAPAALGVLGQHASETNMSASGLLSFLNSQKDNIMHAIPSGLNLAGALGLGSLSTIANKLTGKLSEFGSSVGHTAKEAVHAIEPKSGGRRWLPLILGAIVVIALLILLGKGCNGSDKSEAAVVTPDTTTKMNDTAAIQPAVAPVRESLKVKLPDGVELDAYKGGIEDQLVTFLNDPASKAGKNVWFDFDNLNFQTGSANLTPESMKQVQNIAAILKAYPKVKIKIGGYTDKTGDSLGNIKLSKSRADAVVAALKSSGANMAQVTGGEGYGSQFAKASADAPDEERQKDRRISVSVRAK